MNECYDYTWHPCPEILGATWCCWEYIEPDPWCYEPEHTLCGAANCDGVVDGFDIEPFIVLLGWPHIPIPCGRPCVLDTNGDGEANGFDIDGFVQVIGGGVCPRYE